MDCHPDSDSESRKKLVGVLDDILKRWRLAPSLMLMPLHR
jgi:hypothetical protein